MNKTKSLLESAITECEKHLTRLNYAYEKNKTLNTSEWGKVQ